jgi:hypothetical protein
MSNIQRIGNVNNNIQRIGNVNNNIQRIGNVNNNNIQRIENYNILNKLKRQRNGIEQEINILDPEFQLKLRNMRRKLGMNNKNIINIDDAINTIERNREIINNNNGLKEKKDMIKQMISIVNGLSKQGLQTALTENFFKTNRKFSNNTEIRNYLKETAKEFINNHSLEEIDKMSSGGAKKSKSKKSSAKKPKRKSSAKK